MKTEFVFYDLNNELKKANLILSFDIDNTKFIAYELLDDLNLPYDIMRIGRYEENDDKPIIYDVTDEERELVKKQLDIMFKTIL